MACFNFRKLLSKVAMPSFQLSKVTLESYQPFEASFRKLLSVTIASYSLWNRESYRNFILGALGWPGQPAQPGQFGRPGCSDHPCQLCAQVVQVIPSHQVVGKRNKKVVNSRILQKIGPGGPIFCKILL